MTGVYLLPNVGAEERDARIPPDSRAAVIVRRVASLWALLFAPGCQILPDGSQPDWPEALGTPPVDHAFPCLDELVYELPAGIPWLATDAARAELTALQLALRAPQPHVVHQVSDKGFALAAARERGLVPESIDPYLVSLEPRELRSPELERRLADRVDGWPPQLRRQLTLKPRWGVGGRGRIDFRYEQLDSLDPAAVETLASRGGAILEPWLDRTGDLSAQAFVWSSGRVESIGTARQLLSRPGLYLGNRGVLHHDDGDPGGPVGGAGTPNDREIEAAGLGIAEAASNAGYYGPCGIDSFTYRLPSGCEVLRPVVELNARFTTGFIAIGLVRRALAAGLRETATAWGFRLRVSDPSWLARAEGTAGVRVLRLGAEPDPAVLLLADRDRLLDPLLEAPRRQSPRRQSSAPRRRGRGKG